MTQTGSFSSTLTLTYSSGEYLKTFFYKDINVSTHTANISDTKITASIVTDSTHATTQRVEIVNNVNNTNNA